MAEPQKSFVRLAMGWWLAYLALLAPLVAYSTIRFAPLYAADSLATHAELSVLYKAFVGQTGVALAVILGLAAATFGAMQKSALRGLFALLAGSVTTVAALSLVPVVRFPEDQYPPAALFVIADGVPLAIAFVLATLAAGLISSSRHSRLT